MRLAVRTFLCSFVPLTILLAGSFCVIERVVVSVVRNVLRSMLRDNQLAAARMQSRNERQSKRYLRIVAENAALNAGLQLMLTDQAGTDARLTVEDQLRDLCSAA